MRAHTRFPTVAATSVALLLAGCHGGDGTATGAARSADRNPTTQSGAADRPVPLESESSRFSYAVGLNFGRSLQHFPVALDEAALLEGIKTAIHHRKARLSPGEVRSTIRTTLKNRQQRMVAKREAAAERNRKAGKAFLAENAKRKGVMTTASGLQYMILDPGKGPKPKPTDRVRVHYEGRLIDGTVFDSSYQRGSPATFPLNGVIKGWTEGLKRIGVGGKIRLFIPPELAYGARGAGDRIGPESTLIFDVELLGIEK